MHNAKPGAFWAVLCLRVLIRKFRCLFLIGSVTWRPTHLADRAIRLVLVARLVHLSHSIEVIVGSNYAGGVRPQNSVLPVGSSKVASICLELGALNVVHFPDEHFGVVRGCC